MTQSEYEYKEQKKLECYRELKEQDPSGLLSIATFEFIFDRAYALGKQEKDADTVIQGWVARDGDGDLSIYIDKPKREDAPWDDAKYWVGETSIRLDSTLFPGLTWSDEPLEVEIIIKRKKNG